jgi:hypothetical protein
MGLVHSLTNGTANGPNGITYYRTHCETMAATYEFNSAIRGYHVYRDNWTPVEGEILKAQREHNNPRDKYAIALLKESAIVGHVPREISKTVAFFLKHGGHLVAVVSTEKYQHSVVAGGLEVPCKLRFSAQPAIIDRLKSVLKATNNSI